MVIGHGKENSEIMLVGDSATREDMLNGEALSGRSESTLRSLFQDVNYRVENTYRTLYIKDQLSYNGNNKKKLYESITEAEKNIAPKTYKEILFSELHDLRPNVILPLGELSFNLLTGFSGIRKFRGSVLPLQDDIQNKVGTNTIRVIPTLGPTEINKNYQARAYIRIDINKAIIHKDRVDPIVDKDEQNIHIYRDIETVRNFFKRSYPGSPFVTLDIETYHGLLVCISFCFDGVEAISIPFHDPTMDLANTTLIWREIAKVLASPIKKVNQNIKYDWTILERFGFRVSSIHACTTLATSLLYPEFPKNLGFLNSLYTDMPYFKDEGKAFDPKVHNRDRLLRYNAKDALSAWRIWSQQEEELKELNLHSFFHTKMMPLLHIYKKIDDVGIRIDMEKRLRLRIKYETLLHNNLSTLRRLANLGPDFNFRSPAQVGHLVYEVIKYPVRYKTSELGKKNFNTEEEMLEELMILYSDDKAEGKQILALIIACRKFDKILEYVNAGIHPDGRLRTSTNLAGTETGRSTGGKSLDELFILNGNQIESQRLGRSLQTIPKHGFRVGTERYGLDLRDMFIPSEGYIFIEGDLSQAEARVDAVLAEDYELLKKFDVKPGIHCLTGSWVYGCEAAAIKKNTEEYLVSKIVRHAGERNMTEYRLAMMLHKSIPECRTFLDKFHAFSPNIRHVFHAQIIDFVKRNHYLISPHGRRRSFFGRMDNHTFNEAISTLPQATVSDQMKFAMIPIKEEVPGARFLFENHDSVLAEVPIEHKEKYIESFHRNVEKPIHFLNCSLSRDFELVIPAEISIGENTWGEMKEYDS